MHAYGTTLEEIQAEINHLDTELKKSDSQKFAAFYPKNDPAHNLCVECNKHSRLHAKCNHSFWWCDKRHEVYLHCRARTYLGYGRRSWSNRAGCWAQHRPFSLVGLRRRTGSSSCAPGWHTTHSSFVNDTFLRNLLHLSRIQKYLASRPVTLLFSTKC